MKKTFNYLLFSLAFLLLSSCGKDVPETTAVRFFSGATSITNLQDAVIVAVRVNDGKKMSFRAVPSGMSMTLPNGAWQFYGYGWEGTHNSQVRCAYGGTTAIPTLAEVIYLAGSATSIYMGFTAGICDFASGNNVFHNGSSYVETSSNFSNLRVFFCGEDVTNTTSACMTSEPEVNSYMQIRFSGFTDVFMGLETKEIYSLKSTCTQIIAGFNDTLFKIPPGNSSGTDYPFGLIVDVYPSGGGGCTGAPTKSFYLENGLGKAQVDHSTQIKAVHNTPNVDLFIDYVNYPSTPYISTP
jgi:hypothetical protein